MILTWENYQAVKDPISIEIVGLTVITGPSNRGKSGLIRGVGSLLDNEKGYHFVHKGQEEARIKIEYNGHSVQWVKGPKTSAYYIDGQHNPKSGRSTPKEDITKLGFFELVVQDQVFRPQIQSQFDKPFILSEASPVAAAGLLAASKHGQIIAKAIKNAQKDLSDKNMEVVLREKTLDTLKVKIDKTAGFEQTLQTAQAKVQLSESEMSIAKTKVLTIQALQTRHLVLQKRLVALNLQPKETPPDPPRLGNAAVLRSLKQRWQVAQHQAQAVVGLDKPAPKVMSVGDLNHVRSLASLQSRWVKVKKVSSVIPRSLPPDSKPLVEAFTISVALRWVQRKWEEASKQVEESAAGLVEVTQSLVVLDQENLDLLKALGVCPTCKQEVCQEPILHQLASPSPASIVGIKKKRRSL